MRAACGYVCRPVARGGVRWVRSLLYESSLWVCMQARSQGGGGVRWVRSLLYESGLWVHMYNL